MTCNCCPDKFTFYNALKDFLVPYEHLEHVPPRAYLIYDMSGGKFYILHKNYNMFMSIYLEESKRNHLTVDLNKAVFHTICLDIDGDLSASRMDFYVDNILLPGLKEFFVNMSFSVLVTQKQSVRSGLHIFLPDLKIANDDFEYLHCLLKNRLSFASDHVVLDFPKNFSLPYATKPGEAYSYEPSLFILVSEHDSFPIKLRLSAAHFNIDMVKKQLAKTPKKNTLKPLAFYQFINQMPQNRHGMLSRFMSPIPCNPALKVCMVFFPTTIKETCEDPNDIYRVATFEYMDQRKILKYMYKTTQLLADEQQDSSLLSATTVTYHYLQSHIFRIGAMDSTLYSIQQWYSTLMQTFITKDENPTTTTDIFHEMNLRLKRDNKSIRESVHPVKTLLTFDKGRYFVPVFHALCNEINEPVQTLCRELGELLKDENHLPLKRLSSFNVELLKTVSEKYTYHTILYCMGSMNDPVGSGEEETLLPKLSRILKNEAADMERNITMEKMIHLMSHIVMTYFPIYRNEKDKKVFWNPIRGEWKVVTREEDIRCTFAVIADSLIHFYELTFASKCPLKPADIRDKCYNLITSKNFMENEFLTLDFRYWLLRTNEGCLDLLSLSTSMIVPENFLSNKTLLPKYKHLSGYLHDPSLRDTFRQLWNPDFFHHYVQTLKSGECEDYLQTLKQMTSHSTTDIMLHPYTHLCKYLRFNFEEMRYFLLVLATTLIATNFGKFLFILQGQRNNGKSRLLNILHLLFGQYYGAIDNDTLTTTRKSELKADIVQFMYTCRLVTVEEFSGSLKESLIKNLTGNCMLSARTLYESYVSAIPSAKIFVATNQPPTILISPAFKERVFVFNFSARFIQNLSLNISEQMERGEFQVHLDESILNDTALGFFLHMCFLLEEHISLDDGFLHYPPIPPSLLEFKEVYLNITNTYVQFKLRLDIQELSGESTSLSELQSAIRLFLRTTKNTMSIDEKELLDQFNTEYKQKMYYPDEELLLSSASSSSGEEEDGDALLKQTRAKKMKKTPPLVKQKRNVCYRDILIKGLKRNYR